MNNTIHLPINREWFDMILSGEKKEEYRALTGNYAVRFLCKTDADMAKVWIAQGNEEKLKKFTDITRFGKETVTLVNGYGNHRPRIIVKLLGLSVKHPNPAWCPPGTEGLWFALKLGKVLETHNLPVLAVR